MALIDLISVIPPEDGDEEVEDIFAAAPGLIFPDDTVNMHGDERSTLVYHSARFGDIRLKVAGPESEQDRRLFGHYLWNAGLKMAELISEKDDLESPWMVKDSKTLELGAGAALASIIACLAGAEEVVCSDYPSQSLLKNIQSNAKGAIPAELQTKYSVEGYEWGDLESPFAIKYKHHFTRILAADCFWMPYEHENLVASMRHLLSDSGRILAVGGFHTGRAKIAGFFETAVLQGLQIESIYEENVTGERREWANERDQGRENPTERKRWLVIAVLKRAMQ